MKNILANPNVAILIDDYFENWDRLAFVLLKGQAELIITGNEHGQAINLLQEKYPQYRKMAIDQCPLIKITISAYTTWTENKPRQSL